MSAATPRRPARTDTFTRAFVIALVALLLGAFLAWRVQSHFFADPSPEERAAACRQEHGLAQDTVLDAAAAASTQTLQRCTGGEADWATEGYYEMTAAVAEPGTGNAEPGITQVWTLTAPCPTLRYRLATAAAGTSSETDHSVPAGRLVNAHDGSPGSLILPNDAPVSPEPGKLMLLLTEEETLRDVGCES